MRRLLIALIAVVPMLIACSSPEKEAQDLITKHLEQTITNFDKYTPLTWGELKPVDVLIEHNDEYVIAKKNAENQERRVAEMDEQIKEALALGLPEDSENIMRMKSMKETIEGRARVAEAEVKAIVSAFPYIEGYSMEHSYEWTNALGEVVKTVETFYFDKDFKEVVGTEQ